MVSSMVLKNTTMLDTPGLEGGGCSFVAYLSIFTVDRATFSRRSTVTTPNRDTSNIWVLSYVFSTYFHN